MTRIELARKGIVTDEMKAVAEAEALSADQVLQGLSQGTIVITRNSHHEIVPLGIGKGLRTKINANIGTSKDRVSYAEEMTKHHVLTKYGVDAVMDLSTGGDTRLLRRALMAKSPVAVGTVPIYEAFVEAVEKHRHIAKMSVDDLFSVIEDHARG